MSVQAELQRLAEEFNPWEASTAPPNPRRLDRMAAQLQCKLKLSKKACATDLLAMGMLTFSKHTRSSTAS